MAVERVRVASLQYFIRPVQSFEQFRDQVEGLVESAADYKCRLLVFPEYFTAQLLTLGDVKRPICEQIRSSTVGSLPMIPAASLNYGQAAILTPSDFAFSRDGVLAEGVFNQEMMVIGELNLKTIADARSAATTLPLRDSQNTAERVAKVEVIAL